MLNYEYYIKWSKFLFKIILDYYVNFNFVDFEMLI